MQPTPEAPGVGNVPIPAAPVQVLKGPPKGSIPSTSKASRDTTSLPALPRADLEPQLFLEAFTARLTSLDRERFFQQPVDEAMAPNYNSIIKTPMCFSVMQQRAVQKHYASWRAFCDDFDLICTNAKSYNTNKTLVHKAAAALQKKGHNLIVAHDMELRKALGLLHPEAHMKAGMSTTMATAAPPSTMLQLPPPLHPSVSARRLSTEVSDPAETTSEIPAADTMQAAADAVTPQEVNSEMDTSNPPSPRTQSLQRVPTELLLGAAIPSQDLVHSSSQSKLSNSQVLLSNCIPLIGGSKRQTGTSQAPHTIFLHEPLCPYMSDTEVEEADHPTQREQVNTGSEQLLRLLTSQPLNTMLEHLRTTSTQMPYLNQPCHVHHQQRRRISRAAAAVGTSAAVLQGTGTTLPPSQENPAASQATSYQHPAENSAAGTSGVAVTTGPVLSPDLLTITPVGTISTASTSGDDAAAAGKGMPAESGAAVLTESCKLAKSCKSSSIAWQCSWLELRMQELAEQQHKLECKLQLLQTPATDTGLVVQPPPAATASATAMEIDPTPCSTPAAALPSAAASAAGTSIQAAPLLADLGAIQGVPLLSQALHTHAALAPLSTALSQPQILHMCRALRSMAPAAAAPAATHAFVSPLGTQTTAGFVSNTPSLNPSHIDLSLPPLHQTHPARSLHQSLHSTNHDQTAAHSQAPSQLQAVAAALLPVQATSSASIFPSLQQLESQICMMRARVQQDFKLELGRGMMHRQAGSLAARGAPVIPASGHLMGSRPEGHPSKKGTGGMQRSGSVAGAGKGGVGQGLTVLTRLDSGTKRKRESLDEGSIPILNHTNSLTAGSAPIHLPKVRELSHLECAARLVASTGWLRAVLLDERNIANVPPEVAAVLLDDEGSSSEDTSDESFEARHAFMEAEEHKRYSLVVADKRRSKSSSNTALTGKSGPGLKTPRGHRPEDQPFSPTTTFDALAAVMAGAPPTHGGPFHAHQQQPLAWPHQTSVVNSQSTDQLHLTPHQQQHIAATQLQLQQQHLATLPISAAAASNAGPSTQQHSQQHSLAVAASGGPKVALQRAVSRSVSITLPRVSDATATPLHTSVATATAKPESIPVTVDSSRSLHATASINHHHHATPVGAQLFTPVPHRAPHMLQPPALMYSQPAVLTPKAALHHPPAATDPSSVITLSHPARNGLPGNGLGSSEGCDGVEEEEETVDHEASEAEAEDESEEVMDEDDADVDLADLEHDAHGSGVRKRAGGTFKKVSVKGARVSGSPKGRTAARAGNAAGPPGMPRRSSGSVGANIAGVVTRGREGH